MASPLALLPSVVRRASWRCYRWLLAFLLDPWMGDAWSRPELAQLSELEPLDPQTHKQDLSACDVSH